MKAAAVLLLVLSYLSSCHGLTCKAAPQQPYAVQIDAGEGQVVMTDKNYVAYFLSGSSWSKLGSVPLQHVSAGPAGIWGTDHANQVYKYVAGDFMAVNGQPLQQVDAGGNGQIVGTTTAEGIYCLAGSSASSFQQPSAMTWSNIAGLLKYFSCGPNGCWGTNFADNIFITQVTPDTCATSGWIEVSGAAVSVEVGTDGSVYVVNSVGQVYQRIGITQTLPQGTDWVQVPVCVPVISASYDLGQLWLVADSGAILVCS